VGFDARVDAEGGEDGEGVGTEHEGTFRVGGWGAEFVDCGGDGVGMEGEGECEALRSLRDLFRVRRGEVLLTARPAPMIAIF